MGAKRLIGLETGRTPSGGYKLYLWFQANITRPTLGCHYRTTRVPGQPHCGWNTREEAAKWARENLTEEIVQKLAAEARHGSFMNERRFEELAFESVQMGE